MDVFRGVPETNSHMVPIMRHHTTLTHRWRARALHQHVQITHAQGRLLYVHTLEVLGCTSPVIHPSFLSQLVYIVMTYGGSPVTYGQSHTLECTHCPFSPRFLPPQLNEVQSASMPKSPLHLVAVPPRPRPRSTTTTTEPMTTCTRRRQLRPRACSRTSSWCPAACRGASSPRATIVN